MCPHPWLSTAAEATSLDLDKRDAIDPAFGEDEVSFICRHHVANGAQTGGNDPGLKSTAHRIEAHKCVGPHT